VTKTNHRFKYKYLNKKQSKRVVPKNKSFVEDNEYIVKMASLLGDHPEIEMNK
jgi:hypothetical protein